VSNDVILRREH